MEWTNEINIRYTLFKKTISNDVVDLLFTRGLSTGLLAAFCPLLKDYYRFRMCRFKYISSYLDVAQERMIFAFALIIQRVSIELHLMLLAYKVDDNNSPCRIIIKIVSIYIFCVLLLQFFAYFIQLVRGLTSMDQKRHADAQDLIKSKGLLRCWEIDVFFNSLLLFI